MMPGVPDSLLPLVRHADGRLFKSKHLEYVDFTHPQAATVARLYWKKRLDLGIAGSMIDFGDELPEDAVLADGRRGDEMPNFYAYDYHRQFAKAFEERRGTIMSCLLERLRRAISGGLRTSRAITARISPGCNRR